MASEIFKAITNPAELDDSELALVDLAFAEHWPRYEGGKLEIETGKLIVMTAELKDAVSDEVARRGLRYEGETHIIQ